MSEQTKGRCLCGSIEYEISGNMGVFQYCHCSRCRKFTGSAFAANIFVSFEQFQWTQGESNLGRYSPAETKYFATAFCKVCGSSMPWRSKGAKVMVVPAGTLQGHPGIEPRQNIYCGSKADWYQHPNTLVEHEKLPPRK